MKKIFPIVLFLLFGQGTAIAQPLTTRLDSLIASGFIALEKYFPKEDIYAAILTNVKSSEDKTDFSESRFKLFEEIGELALGRQLVKEVKVNDTLLNQYIGKYQLDTLPAKPHEKKDALFIRMENKKLYATLSNGTGKDMYLSPLSQALFVLPDVKRIRTTIEFIIKDGKVTGLYWTQERKYEIEKVK